MPTPWIIGTAYVLCNTVPVLCPVLCRSKQPMERTSWIRLSTLSWPSREEAPQVSFISVDTASGTSPVAASTTLHDNKHDDAQVASLHVVLERPRNR